MESSKIKPEDIGVLIRVMNLPEKAIIYDPLKRIDYSELFKTEDIAEVLKGQNQYQTCINLSNEPMEVLSFEFILEIGQKARNYASFSSEELLCFNNPDGTIRWLQPKLNRKPSFLHLYNGSGAKAAVFRFIVGVASKLNLLPLIFQNHISLYSAQKNYLSGKIGSKDFALFTGTVGRNRKAVVVREIDNKQTFIKIPTTKKAGQLIRSEEEHLLYLRQFNFQNLNIPQATKNELGLSITNVRPQKNEPNLKITSTHIAAMIEMYEQTLQVKNLHQLDVYAETTKRLEKIEVLYKAGKIARRKKALFEKIKQTFDLINADQYLSVAYAHGDFTSWNMFLEKDKIYVYDWELAMPEQTLFYDLFHFIFQTGVLVLHQSFTQIKKSLQQLKLELESNGLLQKYKLDFEESLSWYLVHISTYYLDLYLDQRQMHKQGWWLIDCWTEALDEALKFMPEKALKYKAVPQK